jgi:hypothetical protein
VRGAIAPHGVRVFFMDEARFGQQGTITDVWAKTGSRPRAVRQTRYEWCYLYAAVQPATGEFAALVGPNVDTGTMNAFLRILDAKRKPDEHIVLVMDRRAGTRASGCGCPTGSTAGCCPRLRRS